MGRGNWRGMEGRRMGMPLGKLTLLTFTHDTCSFLADWLAGQGDDEIKRTKMKLVSGFLWKVQRI